MSLALLAHRYPYSIFFLFCFVIFLFIFWCSLDLNLFLFVNSLKKKDLFRVLLMVSLGSLSVSLLLSLVLYLKTRRMLLGDMDLDHFCFSTSALFLRSSLSGWPLMLSQNLVILLFMARLYHWLRNLLILFLAFLLVALRFLQITPLGKMLFFLSLIRLLCLKYLSLPISLVMLIWVMKKFWCVSWLLLCTVSFAPTQTLFLVLATLVCLKILRISVLYDWYGFVLRWLLNVVKSFNQGKKAGQRSSGTLGGCMFYVAVSFIPIWCVFCYLFYFLIFFRQCLNF